MGEKLNLAGAIGVLPTRCFLEGVALSEISPERIDLVMAFQRGEITQEEYDQKVQELKDANTANAAVIEQNRDWESRAPGT